jgi:hypothetical protein
LYKYLNPNLLVLAVTSPAKSTLTIYLLDNVSGQIVYESKVHSVDTSKSVKTQIVENVVYWSYYSTGDSSGQSRGTRITVAELYESPLKNDRYNKYVSKFMFLILERYGAPSMVYTLMSLHKHISLIIQFQHYQQQPLVTVLRPAISSLQLRTNSSPSQNVSSTHVVQSSPKTAKSKVTKKKKV